jgi:hypothetical protein
LALVFLLLSGCGRATRAPGESLLLGQRPMASQGVSRTGRLTDGVVSQEGDFWSTDLSSRFSDRTAFVQYDLGQTTPLACVLVQGDNNDTYRLLGGDTRDGLVEIWAARPVGGGGMRTRTARLEGRSARYLRLEARGGDNLFAVSELAVWSTCAATFPPIDLIVKHGTSTLDAARVEVIAFALLAAAFILLHRRGERRLRTALVILPAIALLLAVDHFAELWPVPNREQELLRAICAFVAGVVVLKETLFPERLRPDRRIAGALVGVCALGAFGSYYHYGALQFWDAAKGRRTLVHTFDMRHYFPLAKYFRELRFDGLYVASLGAYLENNPGTSLDAIRSVRIRDLDTAEMRHAGELLTKIVEIRGRFSPDRWREFKRDMRYFQDTMGSSDYLGSMQDHGGNATPVWVLAGYAVFKWAPANELTLTLAGLIDPVLLLVLFYFVGRTFGLRVMLYVVVLFGATDFYNFGSNLMGSTLRQDWLVALGLGACALKRRRFLLGGALTAYGGLIRAFPAMAAMFLAAPALVWLGERIFRERRPPSFSTLRQEQGPALRATAGVLVTVVGSVALSSALFGFQGSWISWIKKIQIHATGPSVNNVGLRNVLMYRPSEAAKYVMRNDNPEPWVEWQRRQIANIEARKPLFYLINLVVLALAIAGCRGRPLHQAATIGLLTIPFLFYPSNYYCHFVFLLPLALAGEGEEYGRLFGWTVASVAGLCIGQYFTLAEGWSDLRYTYQSFLLLGSFALILVPLAVGRWWRPAPARAEPAAPMADPALAASGPSSEGG